MAYQNFKPTVWSEAIMRDLERRCVFVEDCNRQYEGLVKSKGESVKILGIGKPTIKTSPIDVAGKVTNPDIDGPEEVQGNDQMLPINQVRYFNYMVGDIDKQQAIGGLMDALSAETSEGLANELDKYVASFAVAENVFKLYGTTPKKVVAGTAGSGAVNVLEALDEAIQKLYENDVSQSTDIVVTVSPRFYTLFKREYITRDTDNSGMLKNGKVGMYGNVVVKMSNNVHKTDEGATDNIMIRTKRAVAFVNPLTHTEAYRPEKKFADAIKGFTLFDGKVVRPAEIVNINVKYA